MIPAPFDYVRPGTVDEAVAALQEAGEDAKILAGGQSLIPVLRLRLAAPSVLIDLGGIPELRRIRDDGDRIAIGAMAPHHKVMRDDLVKQHLGLLAQATATVADNQVRHRGTLGGALAHADPAGDLGGVALALEAEFVIVGPGGTRTVSADAFFVDYFTTALGEDESSPVRFPPPAGAATTRSSTAPRSHGRWWRRRGPRRGRRDRRGQGGADERAAPAAGPGVEESLVGQPATAEAVRAAAERHRGHGGAGDADAASDYREHLARYSPAVRCSPRWAELPDAFAPTMGRAFAVR